MHSGASAGLIACLRGSAALIRQAPLLAISLGAAIVLGLVAACCGIGALITPLFLCELLALQLAHARAMLREAEGGSGEVASVVRHRGWIAACVVLLGAVLLTASIGWLVGLGLGTEIIDEAAAWPGPAWLFVPASALIALLFVLPFLYAPLILIERAATLPEALLESARLVHGAGPARQLLLSCSANVVQIAPLILGSLLAHAVAGPQQGSQWALVSLPLMAVTVPIGQGMIAWSFVRLAPEPAEPALRPTESTMRASSLPRARLALVVWSATFLAPLLAFGTLGASLVRPSRIPAGQLPVGAEPMGEIETEAKTQGLVVPATALTIRADYGRVRIEASDGGGVGRLPLRSRARVDRVRVARTRDRYAIAVEQGALRSVTFVDRAGVRLDDDWRARLDDRINPRDLALLVVVLVFTAIAQLPLLAAAARALGEHRPGEPGSAAEVEHAADRLLHAGLALWPLAAWSVWRAFRAFFGLP